jgi:radical SAM-linked protein
MSTWLLHFSRSGAARYMSHLDTARALQRTFARAGITLALSAGMRPRPRLSVVLPLPVGAAAVDELAVVETVADAAARPVTALLRDLEATAVAGLQIEDLEEADGRPHLRPVAATYACRVRGPAAALTEAAEWVAGQDELVVERRSPKGRRTIDLAASLDALSAEAASDGATLTFTVRYGETGTARVDEVVGAVAARAGVEAVAHDVVRTAVKFAGSPAGEARRYERARPSGRGEKGVDAK